MNRTKLGPQVYEPIPEGEKYVPLVDAASQPLEFTFKALSMGIVFGILFGAANAYLGLRAGLTISTSIPVAVMTVAAFRILSRLGGQSSILEANLSQTTGSASSSVASGIIFTLPALFLWNVPPSLLQMTLLALFGGLLGILFMIPLRRFLIDREHGHLPYPEGTACAEVLVASQGGDNRAVEVFYGLGVGAFFKFLVSWLRALTSEISFRVPFLSKSQVGFEMSAAILGVGYILGPRIGFIMVGGGLLGWLVLIPALVWWGESRLVPLYPETELLIPEMSAPQLWNRYIRYIGAGAVAAGGLLTLLKSIPTMLESFRLGLAQFRQRGREEAEIPRTERDLSFRVVLIGVGLIVAAMALFPQAFAQLDSYWARLLAGLLVAIFGFFFVTVSSRIVGLVGVTSNPTSGMTIATLLGTASIFLLFGWTDLNGQAAAVTVGCVVAIAASIAGDTSQDLKTGFILGATPSRQQTAELIGVMTSSVFVCLAVLMLDRSYGFGTPELPAPQATLMKLVIEGVLQNTLPWALIGLGVLIAVITELLGISSLAFAVGVYLPVGTTATVALGGLVRWVLTRKGSEKLRRDRRDRGILFGSGLVGGEGLLGVGLAAVAFYQGSAPTGIALGWAGVLEPLVSVAALGGLVGLLVYRATRREEP